MSVGKLERKLREHRHAQTYWIFWGDRILSDYHKMMADEIQHLIDTRGDEEE